MSVSKLNLEYNFLHSQKAACSSLQCTVSIATKVARHIGTQDHTAWIRDGQAFKCKNHIHKFTTLKVV